MRYVRFLLLPVLGLLFALPLRTYAQNSPYLPPKGNVGSWSWDKSQPKYTEDGEEREPGETSWERLQAEQQTETASPPQQEIIKSLSPLGWWRWWRGEKKAEAAETPEATGTAGAEKSNPETTTETEEE